MPLNTHTTYLLVDLSCIIVPFIFSFHPRLRFIDDWRAMLAGTAGMMMVFVPWDIIFTRAGIWGFNADYVLGPGLIGLPVEEWLFFICIPYACVFTYRCMRVFVLREPFPLLARACALVMGTLCLTIAFIFSDRWYTFTAHLACGLFLFLHVFLFRKNYLGWFMLTFLIILLPFVISNGVLTGIEFWHYDIINARVDTIAEKVVWYNNDHNLRLRIFSMPLDDLAYGMLMLLMTITIFEQVRMKRATG